jgi:uncharacterized protein
MRRALTAAMKARDRRAVTVLRSALAAIDNAEAVDTAKGPPGEGHPAGEGEIAGAAIGVGAAEAARRTLTPAETEAIVRAEVDERQTAADALRTRRTAPTRRPPTRRGRSPPRLSRHGRRRPRRARRRPRLTGRRPRRTRRQPRTGYLTRRMGLGGLGRFGVARRWAGGVLLGVGLVDWGEQGVGVGDVDLVAGEGGGEGVEVQVPAGGCEDVLVGGGDLVGEVEQGVVAVGFRAPR